MRYLKGINLLIPLKGEMIKNLSRRWPEKFLNMLKKTEWSASLNVMCLSAEEKVYQLN